MPKQTPFLQIEEKLNIGINEVKDINYFAALVEEIDRAKRIKTSLAQYCKSTLKTSAVTMLPIGFIWLCAYFQHLSFQYAVKFKDVIEMNLNVAPVEGPHAGKTLAWIWLQKNQAGETHGKTLQAPWFSFLTDSQYNANLSAAPASSPNDTVLYLIFSQYNLSAYLKAVFSYYSLEKFNQALAQQPELINFVIANGDSRKWLESLVSDKLIDAINVQSTFQYRGDYDLNVILANLSTAAILKPEIIVDLIPLSLDLAKFVYEMAYTNFSQQEITKAFSHPVFIKAMLESVNLTRLNSMLISYRVTTLSEYFSGRNEFKQTLIGIIENNLDILLKIKESQLSMVYLLLTFELNNISDTSLRIKISALCYALHLLIAEDRLEGSNKKENQRINKSFDIKIEILFFSFRTTRQWPKNALIKILCDSLQDELGEFATLEFVGKIYDRRLEKIKASFLKRQATAILYGENEQVVACLQETLLKRISTSNDTVAPNYIPHFFKPRIRAALHGKQLSENTISQAVDDVICSHFYEFFKHCLEIYKHRFPILHASFLVQKIYDYLGNNKKYAAALNYILNLFLQSLEDPGIKTFLAGKNHNSFNYANISPLLLLKHATNTHLLMAEDPRIKCLATDVTHICIEIEYHYFYLPFKNKSETVATQFHAALQSNDGVVLDLYKKHPDYYAMLNNTYKSKADQLGILDTDGAEHFKPGNY